MRKQIVNLWNQIMRIKVFYPIVIVGRKLIFSNTLNSMVDFLERHTNKKGLKETKDFFEKNKERIACNLDCLADGRSRQVYQNIIAYRSTLDRKCLKKARDPYKDQYFDSDLIHFRKKELFIDCGAYIGDTLAHLEHKYPYWNLKGGGITALCLEPDSSNAVKCRRNIKKMEARHAGFSGYIMRKGVWKSETTLYFKEGEEYSNQLSDIEKDQCTSVPAISVDCAVQRYREKTGDQQKVTFIKMDIEGSEPEALIGSLHTIQKDRPVLVISIYHTKEQMISILEYCRNHLQDYQYFIRHYSPAWGETDLYAIPCHLRYHE